VGFAARVFLLCLYGWMGGRAVCTIRMRLFRANIDKDVLQCVYSVRSWA
jgi:hypothetical protein